VGSSLVSPKHYCTGCKILAFKDLEIMHYPS
jgi:hypothetical protein